MDLSEYIGIPYGDHGRNHEFLDCWGVLWLIYKERFGFVLPSYTDRYMNGDDQESIACLMHDEVGPWSQVDVDQEHLSDAILLLIKGQPWHVGMVVSHGSMIHVMKGIDVCLERYDRSTWQHRVIGIYRHEALV